jgi:hypothetical protein
MTDPSKAEAVSLQRGPLYMPESVTKSGKLCSTTHLLTCGVHRPPTTIFSLLLDISSFPSLLFCDRAAFYRVHCGFEIAISGVFDVSPDPS